MPDPPVPQPAAGTTVPSVNAAITGERERPPLLTLGHGAVDAAWLARLVAGAGVGCLVDVRRRPSSRRNPQFNRGRLASTLAEAGVDYRWCEALGGHRPVAADSLNAGVAEPLRGYADHLASAEAVAAVAGLVDRARVQPTAVLCAERDWRRCHRGLLADVVVLVGGLDVVHLGHDGSRTPHPLHPAARRDGDAVRWDRRADRPLPGV